MTGDSTTQRAMQQPWRKAALCSESAFLLAPSAASPLPHAEIGFRRVEERAGRILATLDAHLFDEVRQQAVMRAAVHVDVVWMHAANLLIERYRPDTRELRSPAW